MAAGSTTAKLSAGQATAPSFDEMEPKSSLFAPREGKPLVWRNVNMKLQRRGTEDLKILDNVWGTVPAHQTTAIMGTSGSGKSSLLNVLSGRSQSHGKLKITTDVRLNNYKVDPTSIQVRKTIAFVAQDDSLQVTATPREAIEFSARLRLPRSVTDADLDLLVNNMLEELGLTSCADTIVGAALIKGISGGERKRTSIAVELVSRPAMVFLDEPTSGIDSHNAVRICKVLKKVANAGSSVLFTIHQPTSEIFESFDHLILLNQGRIMYQGHVTDVPSYFAERGHPCPRHFNPADWIMRVAVEHPIDQLHKQGFFEEDTRELGDPLESGHESNILVDTITSARYPQKEQQEEKQNIDALYCVCFRKDSIDELESGNRRGIVDAQDPERVPEEQEQKYQQEQQNPQHEQQRCNHGDKDDGPVGFFTQTNVLFKREIQHLLRNSNALKARIRFSVFMSLLIGCIFWRVAKTNYRNSSLVFSAFGGLIMSQLIVVFGTVLPSLLVFPEERPVFLREYSTNHYSVGAYFASRLAMEICVTAIQCLVSGLLTFFLIGFNTNFLTFYATLYLMALAGMALSSVIGCAVEDPKVAMEMMPILFVPQLLFSGFFVAADLIPVWLRWLRYFMPLTYSVRIILLDEFGGRCELDFICNDLFARAEADAGDVWWYWMALVYIFVFARLLALFILRRKALCFY